MTADIISLSDEKKKRAKIKKKGRGLCQHGFHKWKIWKDNQFDSRQGKLVTVYRCERCDRQKITAL